MTNRHDAVSLLAALALACVAGQALSAPACPTIPPRNPMPVEATPQPVKVEEWQKRQDKLTADLAGKDLSSVRLAFIGDSITQGWDPMMWDLFWGGRSPLNLGLWGDTTQGTLWRLNHGQWNATLHPNIVVLLIGTNNAGWHSRPEDTALGIAEIIRFVQHHSPSTKVLLLGILPRGADQSAPERAVNTAVNSLIQRCANGRDIVYLDPGRAMVSADGHIPNQILFDYLHPTMIGYGILGGAIAAEVQRMMD